jgi:hypothetical protein
MTALLTAPPPRQESLFGAMPPAPPVPRAPAPAPTSPPAARAPRQGSTLDDVVAGAWEGLLAGAPADCPVCGTHLSPRYSAGAGVVGGRCGGCGSTLG